jgi:hypothetical protein
MVNKARLIEQCKVYFKSKGFRKKNKTWLLDTNATVLCFNIQSSQWNADDYFINVGIVIKGIDAEPNTALGKWHVFQRIDTVGKTCDDIIKESYLWLVRHGDVDYLIVLSEKTYQERLPVVIMQSACDFLMI